MNKFCRSFLGLITTLICATSVTLVGCGSKHAVEEKQTANVKTYISKSEALNFINEARYKIITLYNGFSLNMTIDTTIYYQGNDSTESNTKIQYLRRSSSTTSGDYFIRYTTKEKNYNNDLFYFDGDKYYDIEDKEVHNQDNYWSYLKPEKRMLCMDDDVILAENILYGEISSDNKVLIKLAYSTGSDNETSLVHKYIEIIIENGMFASCAWYCDNNYSSSGYTKSIETYTYNAVSESEFNLLIEEANNLLS